MKIEQKHVYNDLISPACSRFGQSNSLPTTGCVGSSVSARRSLRQFQMPSRSLPGARLGLLGSGGLLGPTPRSSSSTPTGLKQGRQVSRSTRERDGARREKPLASIDRATRNGGKRLSVKLLHSTNPTTVTCLSLFSLRSRSHKQITNYSAALCSSCQGIWDFHSYLRSFTEFLWN